MDNFFKSKAFTILSVFLVGFLGFLIFKSKPIIESLNQELSDIENRISESEGKTENLQSDFDYYKSDSYLEKQARLKLNLKNPGENVAYIVRDEDETASSSEDLEGKSFWSNLVDKIFKRD